MCVIIQYQFSTVKYNPSRVCQKLIFEIQGRIYLLIYYVQLLSLNLVSILPQQLYQGTNPQFLEQRFARSRLYIRSQWGSTCELQSGRIGIELIFGPRIVIANWIRGMYRNYLTGLHTIACLRVDYSSSRLPSINLWWSGP